MYRLFALLASLLLVHPATSQQAQPWQQEVHYEMDVTLETDRHRISGDQRLTYTNNSPDTLDVVFYHLYFNAFQPESMMAQRNRELPDPDGRVVPQLFQLGPDEIGAMEVMHMTQDGAPVTWTVYDTVMRVALAQPIMPGASTVFDLRFEGQVPLQTRRSGRDNLEGVRFSMAQWYPKLAAYDAIGWHAHPYIGREFYAPFGTFDVRITLPAHYVVGATGLIQNASEVGHGYDRPPAAGQPTRVEPQGRVRTDSLTWHFVAEMVHDFAWAADPEFIHEWHLVDDVPGRDEPVSIHLFYQPNVAEQWTEMGSWVADLTHFLSERFGAYGYPQFTVAQGGDGGMEYPMLTLITGDRSPGSLFSVTAHEYAHMWFHSKVASNETLFSWIDEGFANYATREAQHHVYAGRPGPADHRDALRAIVEAQSQGIYERPNKPADWYETNRGFGIASYLAGQALIDMLGYIIGDEVRDRFLFRFGTEWRWRHPYPADVLATAQKESGMQLQWLFEQFLTGGERYDYAARAPRSTARDGGFANTVTLERRESGVLPQDVLLRLEDGGARWVHVPLDVAFGHKPVPSDWHVTDPWPWVAPRFSFEVHTPSPVMEVIIDPQERTPDMNRSANKATVQTRSR